MEIFWNGIWGTMLSAKWNISSYEPQLVCRQLGLPAEGIVAIYSKQLMGAKTVKFCIFRYSAVLLCSFWSKQRANSHHIHCMQWFRN